MLETMTKLQTVYLSSGSQGTISFTNIPQNYTDLCVKVSVRSTYASTYYDNMLLTFNGSSSGYSFVRGIGIGNSTSADGPFYSQSSIYVGEVPAATATTNTFSNNEIYFPNYSGNTEKYVGIEKTLENTSSVYILGLVSGLWASTSPINSINFSLASGSFAQFSEVTLYGVKAMRTAVGNSIKATGGAISFDGTYVYHTFGATDVFIPSSSLIADVLTVAGGGAGGASENSLYAYGGGGGGAGGLVYSARQTLSSPVIVTVGAGGAAVSGGTNGNSGTNSQFGALTAAVGGGGGGGTNGAAGLAGGSGGGGRAGATGGAGGSLTSGQGYAGGTGETSGGERGGSGGGAGGAGPNGGSYPYYGGLGSNVYASWLPVAGIGDGYIAGGGVGGNSDPAVTVVYARAGKGSLGSNPNTVYAASAAPNTGSGGGGKGGIGTMPSGAGGSGVVIVRYKA